MHGQFNCYTVMFISSFSHVRLSLDNKRLLTYLLMQQFADKLRARVVGHRYCVVVRFFGFARFSLCVFDARIRTRAEVKRSFSRCQPL